MKKTPKVGNGRRAFLKRVAVAGGAATVAVAGGSAVARQDKELSGYAPYRGVLPAGAILGSLSRRTTLA
jgi:hypothetical protein